MKIITKHSLLNFCNYAIKFMVDYFNLIVIQLMDMFLPDWIIRKQFFYLCDFMGLFQPQTLTCF